MKIIKLSFFLFLFLILPIKLDSYFNYNCENETIFFVNNIKLKTIDVSSFYCDFGKNISFDYKKKGSAKIGKILKYDKKNKIISNISNNEKIEYYKRFKVDLNITKKDDEFKKNIFLEYIKNFRKHENKLSSSIKNLIFSKEDLILMENEIEKQPYKIFENTLGQRLLMDSKIISREEWGASENYSKREVYMKGCEDGSCYTGPVAINTLKDNYIANFQEKDEEDKQIKTFDDGRDSLSYYPVDRIIIHHTAGGYKATKKEAMDYMKDVQKYHALTLRWSDIGYHYLIDGEGNIYEGRAGGKYVLGAHVSTHNFGTVGISLMSDGYYSEKMLKSLEDLVIYLGKQYNLDLTKKVFVRSPDLTGVKEGWGLLAHKELDSRKPKDPDINMDEFRGKIIARIKYEKFLASRNEEK